jgi:hypothetical protein
MTERMHKIGYVAVEDWKGQDHWTCESERHAGIGLPSVAVVAVSGLRADGSLDEDAGLVWGVCIECFGLMDRDIALPWRLPTASHDGF